MGKVNSGKRRKLPLTGRQVGARFALAGLIIVLIFLFVMLFASTLVIVNEESVLSLKELAKSFDKVSYAAGEQLVPVADADGDWCFVTDEDLKVMQLTDVHIGGGSFSTKKDAWAMNAVAAMIAAEKPDLVIVTGDIAYPVPFSAGP